MQPIIGNDTTFCDNACITKVMRELASPTSRKRERIGFLVLSGSFNPVHAQHVKLLNIAKKYLEEKGWNIIAGFLAPSSEAYVNKKYGKVKWSLKRRIHMCNLAIKDSSWISVCSHGELSSNWVKRCLQSELELHCKDLLKGQRFNGVEIMGSDTIIRIFDKINTQNISKYTESTQYGRVICYFLRPGLNKTKQNKNIEDISVDASRLGIELINVAQIYGNISLEPISSTFIRELISKGDWKTLRSMGCLAPAVLKALQTWDM